MKRILIAAILVILMALCLWSTAKAQVSINAGLNTNMQPIGQIGYEYQPGNFIGSISAQIATNNIYPVVGLQAGYTTQNYFQKANYSFTAGAFLHTGFEVEGKDNERIAKVRFGGSFRLEKNNGLLTIGYNGVQGFVSVGFLFRKNKY